MKILCISLSVVFFIFMGCAGFNTAMDIADTIFGDPVIHSGKVLSVSHEIDTTVDPAVTTSVVKWEDGFEARLDGSAFVIVGDNYSLRQSDTRGYYLQSE